MHLIPPADLIIQNGIGVSDRSNPKDEFERIGNGIISEMRANGFIKPWDTVLDIGCGLGRCARPISKIITTGSYIGIDVTKSSIDWCEENYRHLSNFTFIHADVFSTHYNRTGAIDPEAYFFSN